MRFRVLLVALLLAACGGGGGGNEGAAPPPVARFAFLANLGSTDGVHGTLSAFTVNASTGQLRHNGYAVVASGAGLTSVGVTPSNAFVYTTNSAGVWGFSINATTGALAPTPITGSPFSDGGVNPAAIAVDPLGRFVFVANAGGGASAYKITNAATGALVSVGTPVAVGTSPSAISVDPSGRFVYVVNQGSNDLFILPVNATTGALGPAVGPIPAGTTPLGVGVEPSGRYLYVVNHVATLNVLGFSIGANGTLTPFPSGPVSAGNAPRSISFDPAGKVAYVANETSHNVSVFTINPNGVLAPPTSADTQGSGTWSAVVDPSGQFTFAVNQGSGDITVFGVNTLNGTLSRLGSVAGRYSPGAIAITRGSSPVTYTPRFAYTSNLGSSDVSAFTIDSASGALTRIGNPIGSGGTNPFPIAADPQGHFLYVSHENTNNVSTFKIESNGALSHVGSPIGTGGINADGFTVDPSGRFAYASNVKDPDSNNISPFAIDSSNGLLTGPGTLVPSGGVQPYSPAIDPSGRFLYTANRNSNNVSAFRVDAATGTLGPVALQPFALKPGASSPFSLAISPSGKFIYVANQVDTNSVAGNGNVSVLTINLADGSLTEDSGPYPAGAGPRSIAVHPSGRFVYVGHESDSTVIGYQADPDTGVLAPITGSPFPVGGGNRPITVDPSGRFLYAGRTGAAGVSAFPIDSATGALGKVIGGGPVPTGDGSTTGVSPFGITTVGTIQ